MASTPISLTFGVDSIQLTKQVLNIDCFIPPPPPTHTYTHSYQQTTIEVLYTTVKQVERTLRMVSFTVLVDLNTPYLIKNF